MEIIRNTIKYRKNIKNLLKVEDEIGENEFLKRFIMVNRKAKNIIIEKYNDPFVAHILCYYLNEITKEDAFYLKESKMKKNVFFIIAKYIPEFFVDDLDGIQDFLFCNGICFGIQEYIRDRKNDPKMIEIIRKYKKEYLYLYGHST